MSNLSNLRENHPSPGFAADDLFLQRVFSTGEDVAFTWFELNESLSPTINKVLSVSGVDSVIFKVENDNNPKFITRHNGGGVFGIDVEINNELVLSIGENNETVGIMSENMTATGGFLFSTDLISPPIMAFYRGGTDFAILRNYNQDYSLLQIWAPPGDLSQNRESTIALVRGNEPDQEYIDIYNNGYSSMKQYGLRIQKRGVGEYRPFVIDYSFDGTADGSPSFTSQFTEESPSAVSLSGDFTEGVAALKTDRGGAENSPRIRFFDDGILSERLAISETTSDPALAELQNILIAYGLVSDGR